MNELPTILSRAKERREKRLKGKVTGNGGDAHGGSVRSISTGAGIGMTDEKFAELLNGHEDELQAFTSHINHVYHEKLGKNAPFMTFLLCGMQSAGKSTIMERFMNAVLNIVQEGTGTRCPLDTTCIHDEKCLEPKCVLYGSELTQRGSNLTVKEVFRRITEHNQKLGNEDRFSTEPLRLIYKANNVQNMRFIDTPGIISTKGLGQDNREDIKRILRNEMSKANTKLCVLLEPKEFATNEIINFCDETFGERNKWIQNATFLMTKFDKQLEDSRTGNKANNFFNMFHENGCYPHLVVTPTLPKVDLPSHQLYKARMELLQYADAEEQARFKQWEIGHDRYRQKDPSDKALSNEIKSRIGFLSAKKVMHGIMLNDTVKRLPEVLSELRKELIILCEEAKTLEEKLKFNNPTELKPLIATMLNKIEKRVISYLDGNLESARKFPNMLQTLEEEIDDEDTSDWADKKLNEHSKMEEDWRERIDTMTGDYQYIQPDRKFLGGKQVQRAIEFFHEVMIQALPDPFTFKEEVGNATGFLSGGLQRENWEHAIVQVVRTCVKEVSHPGINYLIKHIGCILRRLFALAIDDVKQDGELSLSFRLLPTAVEEKFLCEFDTFLWKLLEDVASTSHKALIPMYSSIDPNLPTFNPRQLDNEDLEENHFKCKRAETERNFFDGIMAVVSGTGFEAKEALKRASASKALTKKQFLSDERTSMTTDEEVTRILERSFEYIVALVKFNFTITRFHILHHLYDGFKEKFEEAYKRDLTENTNWDELIIPDPSLQAQLDLVKIRIDGVQSSLLEVERLQRKL